MGKVKPVPKLYSCLNQEQNLEVLPEVKCFQSPILLLPVFLPLILESVESNANI